MEATRQALTVGYASTDLTLLTGIQRVGQSGRKLFPPAGLRKETNHAMSFWWLSDCIDQLFDCLHRTSAYVHFWNGILKGWCCCIIIIIIRPILLSYCIIGTSYIAFITVCPRRALVSPTCPLTNTFSFWSWSNIDACLGLLAFCWRRGQAVCLHSTQGGFRLPFKSLHGDIWRPGKGKIFFIGW